MDDLSDTSDGGAVVTPIATAFFGRRVRLVANHSIVGIVFVAPRAAKSTRLSVCGSLGSNCGDSVYAYGFGNASQKLYR